MLIIISGFFSHYQENMNWPLGKLGLTGSTESEAPKNFPGDSRVAFRPCCTCKDFPGTLNFLSFKIDQLKYRKLDLSNAQSKSNRKTKTIYSRVLR